MKINMKCDLCPAYVGGFCKVTGTKTAQDYYCPYGVMMRLIRAIKIYGRRDHTFQLAKKVIRMSLDDICNLTELSDYIPVLSQVDTFKELDVVDADDEDLPKIMKTAKDLFGGKWVKKEIFNGKGEDE